MRPRPGLRLGLFGGEAGIDNPDFRRRMEATWGMQRATRITAYPTCSATLPARPSRTTICTSWRSTCCTRNSSPPDTGAALPWREGERGELVLTHLSRECQPLVRFRTGDIVVLTGTGRAACGRTAPRFRIVGRSDDMVVVRGINVFPAQVAAVLNRDGGCPASIGSCSTGPVRYDALPVEAELADTPVGPPPERLAETLAVAIKRELGITARVALLPFGALPRTEGKTRRVIRAAPEPTQPHGKERP